MNVALELAAECVAHGDVPVGALVLDAEGVIIGRGRNQREELGDPTAHAEVIALREAAGFDFIGLQQDASLSNQALADAGEPPAAPSGGEDSGQS